MATDTLFDQATLNTLGRLTLVATRIRSGVLKGERRSVRRGTSLEFADYRNYVQGDDLRRIDWNVFARLERPFIKLFEEEEDLSVYVLIDSSKSMDFPRPAEAANPEQQANQHKYRFAQRLAAGLCYVALTGGDYLTVTALQQGRDSSIAASWGPYRGRGRGNQLLDFLAQQQPAGQLDLNQALRDFARLTRRAGLVLLISDLMTTGGYEEGIAALQNAGHEIALLHILAPDEVDPPLAGDLQLIDAETGRPQDVTIDAAMRKMYMDRLQTWRKSIDEYCMRRGVHYATVETSTPWHLLISDELHAIGLVR
jgi:uncharacterized protein (DUF58 family)